MFHAPSNETKQQSDSSRTQLPRADFAARAPFGHAPVRGQQLARLHSTYGNQAVLRMLSQSAPAIQTKLAVNKPGDEFEQEADRVADQVMRMTAKAPTIQRKCGSCEEEEKVQRKCAECEEEEKKTGLQRKESSTGPHFAPPSVHSVLSSPGHALDPAARVFMEPRFGRNFSGVRVHTDASAADSARAVNALAYTAGQHVVFGANQYSPGTFEGKRLLAHELTHVIHQGNSRIPPVPSLPLGLPGRAEHHGQAHGGSAVSARAATQIQRQPSPQPPSSPSPSPSCPSPSDFPDERSAMMDMMCISNTSTNPKCTLTDWHLGLLKTAQKEALERVQKAHFRMFAVGGPEFAQRLGAKIFTDAPPSKSAIVKVLEALEPILLAQMKFAGGTCADPGCESGSTHAAAYESGPADPVVFCPRSFLSNYRPELRRSVLHEAVHLSGIDIDPNVKERYCLAYTCGTACQSTASADAWTLFIDCLGGPL